MRNSLKRFAAILLAVLMLLAVLPASAWGTEQYSDPIMPGIDLASIVDPDTPVRTYNFKNGETIVSTQKVKNGETLLEPEAPAADEGKVFDGWYTAQTDGEKFTAFGAQTVTETEIVNLYARFNDAYHIYFYTPNGSTVMHTEVVSDHAAHDFSSVTYELEDSTQGVIGWANTPGGKTDVSASVSVPEGQTSVSLYAIIGSGYYVTFETGEGTVVPPRFIKSGEVLNLNYVTKPTLFGYEFGGWYTDEDCTTAAPQTISSTAKLYAKWIPQNTKLTVVFWYENADDADYSYAGQTEVNVAAGSQKSSGDYQNENFEGRDGTHFTYNAEKAETVKVRGDGSSVLNVYFTRNTYTLTFKNGKKTLTCTKTEHTHSNACCENGGTSLTHWWHDDDCCTLGLESHTHGSECYTITDFTITAKYQQDIHDNFPIKNGDKTIWWDVPSGIETFAAGKWLGSIDVMPGENIPFTKHGEASEATIYYYIETLNGAEGTYVHDGKEFNLYKSINCQTSGRLTYAEEFHDIKGFKQYWSDPTFSSMDKNGTTSSINEKNYLCYTRNSYKLKFTNYGTELTGEQKTLQYETPLKDYYFVPDCPANLDPDIEYTFGGWYTTPECYAGSEVDWDKATMPANDVMLYAKWIPEQYTVTFNLGYTTETPAPETQTVDAKKKADRPDNPVREGFTFLGWYDSNENGNALSELPFNFDTPITKDTHLVAHWTTDQTFKLKYDANAAQGGSGAVPKDVNNYADGSKAGVKKGDLVNSDETKVFLGWSKDPNAVTGDYQPGDAMEILADDADDTGYITLYAIWGPKPATTTLTYNANYVAAGAAAAETKLHEVGGSADLLNNQTVTLRGADTFTRTGYKLIGWSNTAGDNTVDYPLGAEVIIDNIEEPNILYAVWEKSTVTLKLTKQVTGVENDATEFTFNVSYQESGSNNVLRFEQFKLKNGDSRSFEAPIGAALTIVESGAANYTTTAKYGSTNVNAADDGNGTHTITGITVNETDTEIVVTNIIKTGKLTIKKLVTGNMGDKTSSFSFSYSYGGNNGTFALSNDKTYELTNIPYGTEVTITENTYNGYTTTYTVGEAEAIESHEVKVTISKPDEEVTFTNHKEGHPDTGVLLDSLPYILILAVIVVIAVFAVIRKRHNRDDD